MIKFKNATNRAKIMKKYKLNKIKDEEYGKRRKRREKY